MKVTTRQNMNFQLKASVGATFLQAQYTRCAWAGGTEFLIHDSRGFMILKNN
jgi:hypothetical protein